MRIDCPYCGVRDQDEFRYGGEASISRPSIPEAADDAEWADYLYYRGNIDGRHAERWLHVFGCRQWFLLVRNTATHEIAGACRLEDAPGCIDHFLKEPEP
jgi:sarcosine oxidase subunit delta